MIYIAHCRNVLLTSVFRCCLKVSL